MSKEPDEFQELSAFMGEQIEKLNQVSRDLELNNTLFDLKIDLEDEK